MAKRIKDLIKELGVSGDVIMEQLRKLYVDFEDENSKVDEKIIGLLRIKLGIPEEKKEKTPKKTKTGKKEPAAKKKAKKSKEEEKPKKTASKKKKEETKEPKKEKTKKTASEEKKKKDTKIREGAEKEKKKPAQLPLDRIIKVKEAAPEEIEAEKAKEKSNKDKEAKAKKEKKEDKPKGKDGITIVKRTIASQETPKPKKTKKKEKYKSDFARQEERRPKIKSKIRARGSVSAPSTQERKAPQKLQLSVPISLRDLAPKMNLKPADIIQYLMGKGVFANINQDLEEEMVRDVMGHFGFELELHDTIESIQKELMEDTKDDGKDDLVTRAPVVTFMGHVDHGKTSLLDYIRDTMVTKGEKGGITQHIGAYKVATEKGSVAFLDTPGHAAFTAMRARGANATDVVVLVVAADDGVMPQTKEAIDHARAADVPIVVAINKCDLPGANADRVKQELQQEGLAAESWGGTTVMVEVSAKTGEGVNDLVEMLMLESELLELKANPKIRARGVVLESKKTAGQGVVTNVLVQNGTLFSGDIVLCGSFYGKVKALINDKGQRINEAHPATPVEILGLQGVAVAGEEFFVVKDEKKARTLSELKQNETRRKGMAKSQRVTLEDIHAQILEGNVKELEVVLKADVQGSVEALTASLSELSTDEVKVNIIHSAVGNINESDIMLAVVSNAIIIGFHVKIEPKAEDLSKAEKVDVHLYDVIYEAIAEIKAGMEGLLEPEEKEVYKGTAQILEVFSSSKAGKIAGCMVKKGVIARKDRVRIKRGQEVIFEGAIDALRRFKDDVKDVREGFECGMSFKGFNNIRVNDLIEAYVIEKVARRLDK